MGIIDRGGGHGFGRRCGIGRLVSVVPALAWAGVWVGLLLLAPLGCGGCGHKPPAAAVPAGPPLVRVRLMEGVSQIKVAVTNGGSAPTIQAAGGTPQALDLPGGKGVPVTLTPDGWRVGPFALGPGELVIDPRPDGTVKLDGHAYRGSYHLVPVSSNTFDVVNHVDVESYLRGVVAKEMFPEFEPEAYKAQAIVARTYALYETRTAPAGRAWDVHDDTRSQVYGGVGGETPKAVAAVEATRGICVVYGPTGDEKIFKAYFSSCCGGATQSAADAFKEGQFEPFTDQRNGARCDVSAGIYHSKFNWGPVTVGKEELARRFRIWGRNRGRSEKNITTVRRIDVARANSSGRPTQFMVTDARGAQYLMTGEELRVAVNTDAGPGTTLYSSYVTPVTEASAVRFQNGHGWGHGVGLCQWCAQAEAKAGEGHERIVLGAYKGATLKRVY